MGTENEVQPGTNEAWQKETAEFYSPGDTAEPSIEDINAPAEPEKKSAPAAERNEDGTFKASADETGDDTDKSAQAEIEGKSGDLPKNVQKRIQRLNAKEEALNAREKAINEREGKTAEPAKAEDTPKTPAHIDAKEFQTAAEFLLDNMDDAISAKLTKADGITEDIVLAIHDAADGDAAKVDDIAAFVVASPAVVKAINELPARKRSAAFEKAYNAFAADKAKEPAKEDAPKPKPKKASEAPEPISRVKASAPGAGGDDFASFEARRNEEDRAAGIR